MKIENQVCSLELAEKLKELGIKQESLFYWVPSFSTVNGKYEIKKWFVRKQNKANNRYNEISAFTASELLEILPEFILPETEDEDYVLTIKNFEGVWSVNYVYDFNIVALEDEFEDPNPCNALAKMYIYLKKNNIINNLKLTTPKEHYFEEHFKARNPNGQFVTEEPIFNDIKFRLYNKDTKLIQIYTLKELISKTFRRAKFKFRGRFTGLKDKNGKEIYEGDIVRYWGGEFSQGFWEYDKTIIIKDIMDCFGMEDIENIKIIGNIYENKNLTN